MLSWLRKRFSPLKPLDLISPAIANAEERWLRTALHQIELHHEQNALEDQLALLRTIKAAGDILPELSPFADPPGGVMGGEGRIGSCGGASCANQGNQQKHLHQHNLPNNPNHTLGSILRPGRG